MAVAMESFSIREYAAKMRGVDYEKCWPFAEERGGRLLPPMPVRKFRWWTDELRVARSGGEAGDRADQEKKATVDVAADVRDGAMVETAGVGRAGDITEASAEERQLRTPPSRAKQRTPKKRSILELFAVAPPIRGAQEQGHRDGGGGGGKQQGEAAATATIAHLGVGDGRDSFELRKRKKRIKDGAAKMLKEKIGTKKKLKAKTKPMKRKKKKKHKVEICAAKKEKTCKLKKSSPADMCKILKNKVYEKKFGKLHKRFVHKQTNPATIRTFLKKHIFRLIRTSKSISRNQEVARMPVGNAIVKKRKRGTSNKKRKTIENTKGSDLVELYCDSAKHLCFSGEESLVHGTSCLPLELPHLKTLCKLVSDVLAASSNMDNLNRCSSVTEEAQLNLNDKEAHLNLNGEGVVTRNVETGENSSEMQLNDLFGHTRTTNSSITKRTPMVEILDLNYPVEDHVDLNCIGLDGSTLVPSPTYSGGVNALGPTNKVRVEPVHETCQEQACSVISDHMNSLHDPIGKPASVSNTKGALSLAINHDMQHWVSCLDQRCIDPNLTDGKTHLIGPTKDACNGFPEFQQMYHIAKDTGISTYSSVAPKATVEPASNLGPVWRDKCTQEGFIGLPLNSQGELIQLHPGTRYGFCQVDKMPKSALSSLQILPSSSHFQPQSSHIWTKGKLPFVSSYHDDDQNWFLKQYYPARKVVLSELGSVELQSPEKMKNQTYDEKAQFNHTDPKQAEFFHCGCRDKIGTESCFNRMKLHPNRDLELGIRSAIQPTMRLMGKNVTVGSYSHGCNDGKAWSDKEIITTNCPNIRMYNRPVLNRWHQEECIMPSESGRPRDIPFTSPRFPSNYCCMSGDKLTSNYMQIGFGSDWMLNDGNSSTSGGRGFHIDLCGSSVPSQSFLNRAPHFAADCSPEAQSVDMGKRKILWAPYAPNICQQVLVNSTHCKHSQSISYSVPSTSHSPYFNQVTAQSSRGHSLQKLPHWMLDSTNQHRHYIPYPTSAYQSCTIPADSGFPHAPPYSRPVVPFPCSSNSSTQTYGSYAPTSVVYPSSITALKTNDFSSVSSTYGDRIKAKDGMVFNFNHVKSQDHSKRGKKRSASKDDRIIETVKRPNLKLQEDSNAPIPMSKEQLLGEQDNIGTSEVNVCASETIDVSLCVADNEKDSVVVSGGFFPLKSSHTRSGPVKLSAGAKHILRPNGSLDQENSCPIYSTVPFTQGTSSVKDANSQEKAAKVYRF